MSNQSADNRDRPDRSTARRVMPIVIAALLIVAGGIFWYSRGGSNDGVPRADLSGAEPSVALRIREASETLRAEPKSQAAWGRLGVIFEVHGYLSEAVTCYERAQTLDPSNPHWPYFLGICRRVSDTEAAARDFQRAAKLKPDYAPLRVNLGEALARLDRIDEAEACYRHAAELEPNCAPAHYGLGRVALARGDGAEAAEHLGKAVRLAPRYRDAHRLLAQAHRRLGDTAAAERESKLAEQGDSAVPLSDSVRTSLWFREGVSFQWRTKRAAYHQKQGRADEALAEWEQALRDDPTLARAHLEIGVLHVVARRNTAAVSAFKAALRIDPDLSEARNNLGGLLMQTGQTVQGLEQLRLSAKAMPDRIDAQFNYALALQRADRTQSAVDVLRRVVEAEPSRPGAYDHLGIALTKLGKFSEAIAALKKGIEALPNDVSMANRLAWLLAACPLEDCRDGKQAVALARRLCAVDGFRSPILLDTLAAAQAQAGDFDAAVRTAQQAIDLIGKTDAESRARLADRLTGLETRLDLYKAGRSHRGPP